MTTDTQNLLEQLTAARDEYAVKCCAGDRGEAYNKVAEIALDLGRDHFGGRGVTLEKLALAPDLACSVIDKLQRLIKVRRRALLSFTPGCSLFGLDTLIATLNQHGHDLGLYVFAGQIVEPSKAQQAARFVALNEDAFAARMGHQIAFGQEKAEGMKLVPCPADLRRAIFGQTHRLGGIEIKRVATTPIWREGKLYAEQGFDSEGHVWIDAPPVSLPEVCDRAAATEALAFLHTELREFAFADDLSRTAAVAAILSAAMRASLRTPAILITKTDHGQGASLLTDAIHIVLTGNTAPGINASKSEVEIDKEVDSACLKGAVGLSLDNIRAGSAFNSISLAQTITADTRQIRILGVSNAPTIECTQLVIANGVNVQIAADLARRFIACKLDPKMENPSERKFERTGDQFLADVKRDRSKWLAACYTIVTAYHNSGTRARVKASAGFETWCSTVSAALVWLGCEDVIASQAAIRAQDPATAELHALATVWLEIFGEQEVTVRQLSNATCDFDNLDDGRRERVAAAREALSEMLARISKGRTDMSTAIGTWLAKYAGRVIGEYQLSKALTVSHGGSAKWRWKRVEPPEQTDYPARPPAVPAVSVQPKPKPTAAPVAAPAAPKTNGVDKSWKQLPCQNREFKCPGTQVEVAQAAFTYLDIDVRGTRPDANNSVIFVTSMPVDATAYGELKAKVIALVRQGRRA